MDLVSPPRATRNGAGPISDGVLIAVMDTGAQRGANSAAA